MKKVSSIIGIISGALSIVFSFIMLGKEDGSWENYNSYGGDAYTGIQNAAAQTANNVYYLNDILRFGFFAVLFIAGIVLLCVFIPMYFKEKEREEAAAAELEEKRNAYWEANPGLKDKLIEKKDAIEAHIKKLTDDIDNIPEKKDLVALQDQWDSLDKEAAHLGKTDDEKKNEIQSKADVIYAEIERLSAIIKEKEATIQENIQTQKNSLLEIEKELNPEL